MKPPPKRPTGPATTRTTAAAIARTDAVAALVVCCAGPGLLAAGVLGAIGALLSNPWMIAAALLLAAGTVAWRLRRHRACDRKNHPRPGDR
ncbi:mercury transporter [Streptomyces sp. NPDC054783]